MEPLVFAPFLRPAIWGGRRLGELLGKPLVGESRYGESWEVSAHPGHISRVAEGPLRGLSLDALVRTCGRELFGNADGPGDFPLLVKYLDARGWLSLQVHPNDRRAARLAGEARGKTEAWVVLEAAPGARVYSGLRQRVNRLELEDAILAGHPEECLHGFVPRPGDCLFLPAGTVHAAVGVVLAEVQQSSDATLRLYDWGRVGADGKPRTLHLPQAMAAINWEAGPVAPVEGQPLEGLGGGVTGERLVQCRYFVLDRFAIRDRLLSPHEGSMSVWMVLAGKVELRVGQSFRRECRTGDTLLIAASAKQVEWQAADDVTLLAATLPASA